MSRSQSVSRVREPESKEESKAEAPLPGQWAGELQWLTREFEGIFEKARLDLDRVKEKHMRELKKLVAGAAARFGTQP